MEINVRYTITVNVMTILTVIGLWKILEDNGIEGWKAIIPFYSSYLFGEVAGEPEKGKKQMRAEILTVIFAVVLTVFAVILLGYSKEYMGEPGTGVVGFKEDPPLWLAITTIVLAVLTVIFAIRAFVMYVQICDSYDRLRKAPGWFIVFWIFLKGLAFIYFAFIHDNYNIRGISKKKDPQEEETPEEF